jgi:2',3'-cyclic-nucleotide 2'-phosphodiesterase (5'-nucleotidase family)
VTRRALFELCPFDNNVVALQMSGAELFEFLQRSIADPEHSGVEVSGVTLQVNEERELLALNIAGEPCDPLRVYRVAMNSFMASGGDGYLDLEAARHMMPTEDPRTLRQLLEEHFLAVGSVTPDPTNRYELVQ